MRVFSEQTFIKQTVQSIQCNVCARDVIKDRSGYFEDHLSISKAWGYHSPYDGEIHGIDVCIDCYHNWTASFVIPPKVSHYCLMTGAGDVLVS